MFKLQQASVGADRRVLQRAQVSCPMVWDHRRLENQPGELRDISQTGLFIRPRGGTVRFRPDDVVWGALRLGGTLRVFSAIVRWRGWSLEHRCVGLGLELEAHSHLSEDELHAVRWPRDASGRPLLRVLGRHR